ncbi:hypothetical protein FB472_2760 [Rhodoglobus vestalii]|uniref:Uncharacterized protein n=1 Tax=Rhodoglobus vestalii TaxID=193384 RepID=A0A8H2K6Q3_9MICO|nr:hypothetical protein [Rhodoglobus vestalii]TQO21090.1 hypothetical protein FB472_2760 [Rhodoglobus vestalii]
MNDYSPDDNGAQELELRAKAQVLGSTEVTYSLDGAAFEPSTVVEATSILAVKLGVGSHRYIDSTRYYAIAVETPAPETDAFDAVAPAIARASCARLFTALRTGWSETTDHGTVVHHALVPAVNDAAFQDLIRSLPTRETHSGPNIVAKILFRADQAVLPSITADGPYTLFGGQFAGAAVLTGRELMGIAVVLDESSDRRDGMARGIYDIREHDAHTNDVRDRFNRTQNSVDVERQLVNLDWRVTEENTESVHLTKDGFMGELLRSTGMFIERGERNAMLKDDAVAHTAFDLLIGIRLTGALTDANAESAANWLVEHAVVTTDLVIFSARGKIPQIERTGTTQSIIKTWAETIRVAHSSHDAATPLALRRTVTGITQGVVSVTPSGELKSWVDRGARTLLIASGQLSEFKGNDDQGNPRYKNFHEIPETIVEGTIEALRTESVLPALEYFGREPLITREGQVISEHGYDMANKAFLSIPRRERRQWRDEYNVPRTPSLADAQAAYELLDLELLGGFPFEHDRDGARALCYVLTAVCRSLTTGSPAWLAVAQDRGVGKTLLLMVGRILAQGSAEAASYYFGRFNDDETTKAIATALRKGASRFVHCDEIPRGDIMKSIVITETITGVDGDSSIRILGSSESVIRSGLIVSAAGNNVETGGDLGRRFIKIALVKPQGKQPALRNPNLIAYVNKNRPALLAAVHTIVLFGMQNEVAHQTESMRFSHNWQEIIVGAMTHLRHKTGQSLAEVALDGWAEEIEVEDELGSEWGNILATLWAKSLGQPKDAAELAILANNYDTRLGEVAPVLPPKLVGHIGEAAGNSRIWSKEISSVNGTSIPHDGATYVIRKIDRAGKTRRALQYAITCFNENGLVLPGRDPNDLETPQVAENDDEVLALEFS